MVGIEYSCCVNAWNGLTLETGGGYDPGMTNGIRASLDEVRDEEDRGYCSEELPRPRIRT